MTPIKDVDISSPAFKANPYPFYAQLRDQAPVHRIILGDKRPAWLVTRYDDVVAVLKDDRFVKDKRHVMTPEQMAREPWIPKMIQPIERNMLDADGPNIPGCADSCTWRSRHGSSKTCATHPAIDRRAHRCDSRGDAWT